jgi:heme exporter protein D
MTWAEFFSMGGRGFYVWGSYGAFAVAIIVEIILLRARAKHARAEARAEMLAGKSKGGAR